MKGGGDSMGGEDSGGKGGGDSRGGEDSLGGRKWEVAREGRTVGVEGRGS